MTGRRLARLRGPLRRPTARRRRPARSAAEPTLRERGAAVRASDTARPTARCRRATNKRATARRHAASLGAVDGAQSTDLASPRSAPPVPTEVAAWPQRRLARPGALLKDRSQERGPDRGSLSVARVPLVDGAAQPFEALPDDEIERYKVDAGRADSGDPSLLAPPDCRGRPSRMGRRQARGR